MTFVCCEAESSPQQGRQSDEDKEHAGRNEKEAL